MDELKEEIWGDKMYRRERKLITDMYVKEDTYGLDYDTAES